MKMIVLNFIQGNGPYCRTAEAAILLNRELKKLGREPMGFIMPLVYGEKQRRILEEECGHFGKEFYDYIFFSAEYGALLGGIFYKGGDYCEELKNFIANQETAERKVQEFFRRETVNLEKWNGEKFEIKSADVMMEMNRNPRLATGIKPSYSASIGLFSRMLREGEAAGLYAGIDKEKMARVITLAEKLETVQKIIFLAEPSAFAEAERAKNVETAPPLMVPPEKNNEKIEPGIYITLSGIAGLEEKYYGRAKTLSAKYKIYTNKPDYFGGRAEYAPPSIASNDNILAQIARSGWSSVWLPMIFEKPFITFPHLPGDDPEIHFNLKTIEKLKLGAVWRENESFESAFSRAKETAEEVKKYKQYLLGKFGTLNGLEFCAKRIADDFTRASE